MQNFKNYLIAVKGKYIENLYNASELISKWLEES